MLSVSCHATDKWIRSLKPCYCDLSDTATTYTLLVSGKHRKEMAEVH